MEKQSRDTINKTYKKMHLIFSKNSFGTIYTMTLSLTPVLSQYLQTNALQLFETFKGPTHGDCVRPNISFNFVAFKQKLIRIDEISLPKRKQPSET